MAFYVIQEKWDSDYDRFLEDGVFDERGIKKARELLLAKCREKIQKRHDEHWKARNAYIDELVTLEAVLEYNLEKNKNYTQVDAIKRRISELNKKAEDERKESFRLFSILNSQDEDSILDEAGYKIVQVPIFSYCDEKLLKDFL